jgi:hypothetical protein
MSGPFQILTPNRLFNVPGYIVAHAKSHRADARQSAKREILYRIAALRDAAAAPASIAAATTPAASASPTAAITATTPTSIASVTAVPTLSAPATPAPTAASATTPAVIRGLGVTHRAARSKGGNE